MNRKFVFEIITPIKSFYKTNTTSIIVNTPTGKLGIMAGHESSLISVSKGLVKIKDKESFKEIYVSTGFMEIKDNNVVIFVENAVLPEKLTEYQDNNKKVIDEEMRQRKASKEERVKMQSFITKAINDIKLDKNKQK